MCNAVDCKVCRGLLSVESLATKTFEELIVIRARLVDAQADAELIGKLDNAIENCVTAALVKQDEKSALDCITDAIS